MDGLLEPAPQAHRGDVSHLLSGAGLLVFTGYLLFVLVEALLAPTPFDAPDDARVSVRIESRPRPAPTTSEPARQPPVDASDAIEPEPALASQAAAPAPKPVASPAEDPRDAGTVPAPRLDLRLPASDPALPALCRAGPCLPETINGRPARRRSQRPASEVLADLDPEVLESLDLRALGIEREGADVFGALSVAVSENCELVQRADTVATRQMRWRQFLRCGRSSESKARAAALLDALREKRPDLFEDD